MRTLYEVRNFAWHRQSVVLAETRELQVRVGADFPSMRGDTGHSIWVMQQRKVVGCCPGVQALTIRRCFAVAQLTRWHLKLPACIPGCGNVGMVVSVSNDLVTHDWKQTRLVAVIDLTTSPWTSTSRVGEVQ